MSLFPNIDPTVETGIGLAALLNSFRDSVASGISGAVRDPLVLANGNWWDISTIGSDDLAKWKYYNGVVDKTILTLNTITGAVVFAPAADLLEIVRQSADSVGPIIQLIKKRIANGGQTLDQDILGEINFIGIDTIGTEYTQAKIYSQATDDVTNLTQGADLIFDTTPDNASAAIESMRLKGNGFLGVGTATPDKRLVVQGNTTDAEIKLIKNVNDALPAIISTRKINGLVDNGQTKNANVVSNFLAKGTDQNGASVDLFKIEVIAKEDVSDTAQGNEIKFYNKKTGENTFSEFLSVDETGNLSVPGLVKTELQDSTNLLDDQATRNLFTIDGNIYGSFNCEVTIWGKDNSTDVRAQHTIIKGIYNQVAATWYYSEETEVLESDKIANFSYTNATTFTVDYINQIAFGVFQQGKIDKTIRRVIR